MKLCERESILFCLFFAFSSSTMFWFYPRSFYFLHLFPLSIYFLSRGVNDSRKFNGIRTKYRFHIYDNVFETFIKQQKSFAIHEKHPNMNMSENTLFPPLLSTDFSPRQIMQYIFTMEKLRYLIYNL